MTDADHAHPARLPACPATPMPAGVLAPVECVHVLSGASATFAADLPLPPGWKPATRRVVAQERRGPHQATGEPIGDPDAAERATRRHG